MNELKNQNYLPGTQASAARIKKIKPILSQLAGGRLWLLLWLILFGFTFAWRAQNLDAFGLANDEGAYLMWTRLAVDGYPLYTETRAVQPPLFFEWLGLAFRLGGQTIQAGRWAILISFLPLAVVLSWLAHRAGGWPAALLTNLFLGLAPLLFRFSRLVMAEVPATALAVLSLGLVFLSLERGHRGWLLGSGFLLGVSLMMKALNPFIVVPIALLLMRANILGKRWSVAGLEAEGAAQIPDASYRRGHWPDLCLDGLFWGAGLIIPVIAVLFFYDIRAMYDQVVTFRSDLRAAIPGAWAETLTQFEIFFKTHWGFWLLAFGGIIATLFRRPNSGPDQKGQARAPRPLFPAVWFIWLLAGAAMLAWHTPLFAHHFVVLLPPLILLGATFVTDVIALWRVEGSSWYVRLFLTSIIGAAALNLPAVIEANQETAAIVTGGREAEAISLLEAVSGPDDFVMGDSQLLIFMADRRTPPPLGDVALVAIKAGRQTSDRMIDLTWEYRSPAVVQWSLRLPWLPEYLSWVESNYLARRVWDNNHVIYFGPRFLSDQSVPNENRVPLGDKLTFYGYELDSSSLAGDAGPEVQLKLYWQANLALTEDYTIFTQLLDNNGKLVAGWDSQPLGGYFPTSQWPTDEIITDIVQLPLPADLPAGSYTLITGMYKLNTLERLLTPDGQDHIVLTPIRIE